MAASATLAHPSIDSPAHEAGRGVATMIELVDAVRHKLTIDDYVRLGETGILAPDSRVELIEGELIEMAPIGPRHTAISMRLNRLLVLGTGDAALVAVSHPVLLPPYSMPQPDFMLLRPQADDYQSGHPDASDVLLAVEVSDSSLRYDRITKSRLYARHGVVEYWVVEAGATRLHRFRSPEPGRDRYAREDTLEAPFTLAPDALPALAVGSDAIWRP
jgi:Uma2 family endonuclease